MSVVGALLENEGISGLSEGKQMGLRRTSSGPSEVVWTPDDLISIVSRLSHSCIVVTVIQEIIGHLYCTVSRNTYTCD